jgi:D-alanyl-D-alanine carboxypeptidase/D-alanyl-D-alanine-endopeptidase (penicillin-binding protein 4)
LLLAVVVLGPLALRPSAASRAAPPPKPGKKLTTVVVGPRQVDEAPVPPEGDHNRERVMRMQEALRSILQNATMRRARVGIKVMDAGTGRLYFEKRGATLMDPASNQKVLASATALLRLGSEWRFRTELLGPEPNSAGAIEGDVYLRGSGDPTIRSHDLDALAARLARRGIRRIDGGVVADMRRLGSDEPPGKTVAVGTEAKNQSGGDAGDEPGGHQLPRAPLVVNRGFIVVRVRPGAAAAPAIVSTNPSDESFVIHNMTRTKAGARTRVSARVLLADGRMRVDVAGTIAPGHPGLIFRRKVPHPALHAAVMLRAALTSAGILVRDRPRAGVAPAAVQTLESHESASLGLLLHKVNKDSDNDHAERVLEAAGAEVYGGAATPAKGVALLREVIDELGLPPSSYAPKNGSGLGHANRITAEAMARLLRTLYLDPRIGPEIMQSLSVGGVDGTTRNRFKGTLSARRVRAKTGTLNGKSCLSGFVGDGSDVVIFSIMVDGMRSRTLAAVRGAQVSAVNAMMRYVREGTGERVDLPIEVAEPRRDFESGEEILESEGEATESGVSTADDPIDTALRKAGEDHGKDDHSKDQRGKVEGARPVPRENTEPPPPQTP